MPMGQFPEDPGTSWTYGDVDAAFKNAALVLDETFVTPDTSHQCLEPRSTMAYWQNGKVYVHTGTQSLIQTVPADCALAQYGRRKRGRDQRIYWRRIRQQRSPRQYLSSFPALLSKKCNAPVMMRVSREEEHFIGRARPSLTGRMKAAFSKEGRITALDMFSIINNGPYDHGGRRAGVRTHCFAALSTRIMRFRGLTVLTNTPPRGAQSSPGGMQGITLMEPILAKAARKLGIDQVAIRKINAPEGKAPFGPAESTWETAVLYQRLY